MCLINIIIAVTCIVYVISLEVVPERASLEYVNPKYAKNAKIYVRRLGRHSPYSLNIEGTTLTTFGNNVTLELVFYELLNNEYKPSFVEMNFKLCDLINTDKFFSPLLRRIGIPCPVPPNEYKLLNLTLFSVPAVENFPYKWPFEKGKAQGFLRTYPGKELIGKAYCMLWFKNSKKAKEKS